MYTMKQYLAIKGSKIVSFAETQVDPEMIIQSEVSQKEKNKYCVISLVCGIQKNGTDELNCKAQRQRCGEQTYRYQGREQRWDEQGDWD